MTAEPNGPDGRRLTRIRLLGQFRVEAGGTPIAEGDLGNRKARLLLKLLAARHGRHVPMDLIVDALWDTTPPAKPAENVASLVSRLRTALGSDAIEGGRAGYRLVLPARCIVDIDEAVRLVDEAEARLDAGQPALAATAATNAREAMAAAFLEEETASGEWIDEIRRELERLVRRARLAGWRASAAVGEHRRVIDIAEAAIAADPLDEEAHRAVIAAYHRLGEPGEALAAYERVRTTLVEELGADPAEETQALYLAVLRGEPIPEDRAPAQLVTGRRELVGRDGELAALLRCWEEASRGMPACVLVVGESGIGKTRLVEALADEVRPAGAVAVAARCYESEASLFLQPAIEALRELVMTLPPEVVAEAAGRWAGTLVDLVPELSRIVGPQHHERSSPEMERRHIFEAVASFLAGVSKRRPLLVVLDDAHNAGASTLELVHFVLRWDRAARLLIVGTVQSDRGADVEAQLAVPAITVRLGPLTERAVAMLAAEAGHADRAGELMRRTKGHTLFVLEALHALEAPDVDVVIPESLRSAVITRVSRCGPDVDDFLRGAVVAGSAFDVETIAELLGLTGEEAVRRAESALRVGLLTVAGGGYEFANDVIRDVLYESTPAPTRLVRHRRLATLLQGNPEAAAEHAAAAADWPTAVDRWVEAAGRSLGAFANREAEELLTRAFDACSLLGDPSRTATVQLLRGRARLARDRYRDANDDFAAVHALARATGATDLEVTALEELGWCAYHARQMDRANEFADRALQHPRSGPRTQVLAGRLRHARGDLDGAAALLEPVAANATDPAVRASALSYMGSVLAHRDRFADAATVLDAAAATSRVAGALRAMVHAGFFRALSRANLGDLVGAFDAANQLAVDVERYEAAAYRPRASNLLSWLRRELGDAVCGRDLALAALEQSRLPDGFVEVEPQAHARLQLAECALLLGDEAEAASWLDELSPDVVDSVWFGWRVELHRVELLARLDASRAEELLALAQKYGSLKYQALAFHHLGRAEEAAVVAAPCGSDLLLAHVAPDPIARQAADRLAGRLGPEERTAFLERGAWRLSQTG